MKADKKGKFKLVMVVVAVLLAVVIFLQNTETVETRLLLLTIPMSRALLLMLTFLLGLLTGVLLTTNVLRKKSSKA